MIRTPSARQCALDLLSDVVERRRPLDEALDDAHGGALGRLSARDRAFARLLAATTLRRLGQIDALLAHCLDRPLPARARRARAILRLGAAQLVFLATPPHAVVDTAVALAGRRSPHKGLVNAVLRRLAREGTALAAAQDAARLNTPEWLWRSWRGAYGEAAARAIAVAHLEEAPLDLTAKGALEAWAERLEAVVLPTGSLRRPAGGRIEALPGFAEGAWWVQDAAAALPARLAGDVAGKRVLDLCAAPGGKTAQLAAAGARVTALDRSASRLGRLALNLERLGLEAGLVAADALEWRPSAPAEVVLLDVPCSATGTIRRHPDVPRLRSADDVGRLAALQARLLDAALDMVAPGGLLIYCACSLEPEEGEAQVATLLDRGAPLARVPITAADVGGGAEFVTAAGDLRTLPCHWPGRGGLDGFYAARLRRLG